MNPPCEDGTCGLCSGCLAGDEGLVRPSVGRFGPQRIRPAEYPRLPPPGSWSTEDEVEADRRKDEREFIEAEEERRAARERGGVAVPTPRPARAPAGPTASTREGAQVDAAIARVMSRTEPPPPSPPLEWLPKGTRVRVAADPKLGREAYLSEVYGHDSQRYYEIGSQYGYRRVPREHVEPLK